MEQHPRDFTLPCTIGNFNFYAMADLGASTNVMPKGIFDFLKVTNLRKTNMLIEMADMTKKAPLGVVENMLVGIDKFLFPSDFVIIDRTLNEIIILGKPFLITVRVKILVFDRKITLGIDKDRIVFDLDHNLTIPIERILMKKLVSNEGPSHTLRNPSLKQLKIDNSQDREEQQVKKKLRMKSHMLEMIWENYMNTQGKVKEWWYDYWLEDVEKMENGDIKYDPPKILQHILPPMEQHPRDFTLPCTIGNFNFYAMADLGASINVMPKGIFDFLKVTNLSKTNMLIEMADMTKKAPLGVVENVLVGIDKFLFPSDFVIIDRTLNEIIILGRPFLITVRVEILVFDRKITLGIDKDRIAFDLDHNLTIPIERILMKKLVSNEGPSHTPGNPSLKQLKIDNSQDREEQQVKKKLRYGVGQLNDSTWGQSYAEWYKENLHNNKPMPRGYSFKVWMIVKVGHTNVNESVKMALLKSWMIDCFEEALDPDKDPKGRSFDD
nr:hypothetical protein [Tanacetum cinerariifolium]